MKISKTLKKILFIWVLFHSVGYMSYLLEINPKIDRVKIFR